MPLAVSTLIGVMLLTASVGFHYYNWVRSQKAADAAAGVSEEYLSNNVKLCLGAEPDQRFVKGPATAVVPTDRSRAIASRAPTVPQ